LGFGLLFGGRFATIQTFHATSVRSARASDFFDRGFALEALVTKQLLAHLAVKAGLTFDGNLETTNAQPIALGVIRF
jgi:hypothetical protein